MFDQKNDAGDNFAPIDQAAPTVAPSVQPPVMPKFNNAKLPADIFSDVEAVPEPTTPNLGRPTVMPQIKSQTFDKPINLSAIDKKIGPVTPLSELPDDADFDGSGKHKFIWLGILVAIAVIGIGGYFAYAKLFSSKVKMPATENNLPTAEELKNKIQNDVINLDLQQLNNQNQTGEAEQNPNAQATSTDQAAPAGDLPSVPASNEVNIDSDHDGLTDVEEKALGTDFNATDSDGDGLFDREEVKVYQTDPLNPDTDGDGYVDGEEVQNGYNPKGPGKMLKTNF